MARKTKSQEFIEFVTEEEPVETGLPSVEADYVEEDLTGEWYTYTRINLNELEDGGILVWLR